MLDTMELSTAPDPSPAPSTRPENDDMASYKITDEKSPERDIYGQALPYIANASDTVPAPSGDGIPIKQEAVDAPLITVSTTPGPVKEDGMDEETRKAIAAAQSELGIRARAPTSKLNGDLAKSASPAPNTPDGAAVKKRAPPKSAAKRLANGTKRPPSKKRKLDINGGLRTTPRSVSETPTADAAHTEEDDPGSETDPDQVYCLCRKPDNHTWMVGCDGGCDDWFHGKCVDMRREDEGLIDHFICPNCEAGGKGVTTWLPMCRRDECRNPARVKLKKSQGNAPSKYCSDACGVAFMKATLARAPPSPRNKDTPLGPLGGPIRASELNALLASVSDIAAFRALGDESLPTPPPSQADPEPSTATHSPHEQEGYYTAAESARLAQIAARKALLRRQKLLCKDRMHLVTLVRERVAREADALGASVRDFCWFDARVAWDDASFTAWRESDEGRAVFAAGRLGAPGEPPPPERQPASATPEIESASKTKAKKVAKAKPAPTDLPPDLCSAKTCRRHHGWQKLALQDPRFEEACVGDEMRRIDAEEGEIRVGAGRRARERAFAKADTRGGDVGNGRGGGDGAVEVVWAG